MMIKCQECGHENQLGSIFCRSCGKKLDLEAVNPEIKDSRKLGVSKILRRIITLLILLLCVGVMAGLFMKPDEKGFQALDDKQKLDVEKKYSMIGLKMIGAGGKTRTFTFSKDEATFMLNNLIFEKTETSETNPQIELKNDYRKKTYVIIHGKLLDKLPIRLEMSGVITNPAPEEAEKADTITIGFKVSGLKMGLINLPDFLKDQVLVQFMPIIESPKVNSMLKAVREISVDDNSNFVVTMKNIQPPPQQK